MSILYIIAPLLLFFLIPKTRPHVRYFVGYLSFGLIVMTGAAVYSIYKLARSSMGLHPLVYGLETFDNNRQYIYVCNHQSFIDVLTLSDVWGYPSTVIAKNSLKYLGPLGAILYFTKVILIHRGDHAKALSELNRAAEIIKNDKVNLFMFPEGTRNHNGVMLPFKKGAFHLAIQTQLPIQPVVISCYNSFLDHKNFSFNPDKRDLFTADTFTFGLFMLFSVWSKQFENPMYAYLGRVFKCNECGAIENMGAWEIPYGVYLLSPIETKGMDESQVDELIEKTHSAMREVFDLTAKASREDVGKDLRIKTK
ncbi:hypothetical protein ACTXT7_008042 [Hymenolepis weldensis]